MNKPSNVLIIAEAGVNHNGCIETAKKLIDAAQLAGADIVKFQTFKTENLVTKTAKKAAYQSKEVGADISQFEMLKKLELSFDDFLMLSEYCQKKDIEFLSTAFDEECLEFLIARTKIKRIKIPSGEITNGPLLHASAKSGLPLIVSTGMCTLQEVEDALDVITWTKFGGVLKNSFKRLSTKNSINCTLLHCTSEYPAPFDEIHLNAMPLLKRNFQLPVGFSDHSVGISAPLIATAMGATLIEKHFTLSKTQPGPDHQASLDPKELTDMVDSIRKCELIQGHHEKVPSKSELENSKVARKSLVASKSILKGQTFTPENITSKRPGTGISPMKYWDLIGRESSKAYDIDQPIDEAIKGD